MLRSINEILIDERTSQVEICSKKSSKQRLFVYYAWLRLWTEAPVTPLVWANVITDTRP